MNQVMILHECPTCENSVDVRRLRWTLQNKLLRLTAQSITIQETLERMSKKNPLGKFAAEDQLRSLQEEIRVLGSLIGEDPR